MEGEFGCIRNSLVPPCESSQIRQVAQTAFYSRASVEGPAFFQVDLAAGSVQVKSISDS